MTADALPLAQPAPSPLSRLLRAAWWAIGLGLVVQAVVLTGRLAAGGHIPGLTWLGDVAGGVTWSVIVCGGVAVGSALARARGAFMGILGLISAPVGFAAAKGAQRVVQRLLEAPVDRLGPIVYSTAAIKGVEYALLGLTLAALLGRPTATLRTFAFTGAAFGLVFGCLLIGLNLVMGHPTSAALTGMALNEFLFPAGCASVIYLVSHAGRQIKALQPA